MRRKKSLEITAFASWLACGMFADAMLDDRRAAVIVLVAVIVFFWSIRKLGGTYDERGKDRGPEEVLHKKKGRGKHGRRICDMHAYRIRKEGRASFGRRAWADARGDHGIEAGI